ncbi:MAG: hypothetical protein HYW25_00340 [Candidatus Aenigmarchaeota archaeon]|nr:hypothetical protein [Candidatus Aenigmarchaeota archaeon]
MPIDRKRIVLASALFDDYLRGMNFWYKDKEGLTEKPRMGYSLVKEPLVFPDAAEVVYEWKQTAGSRKLTFKTRNGWRRIHVSVPLEEILRELFRHNRKIFCLSFRGPRDVRGNFQDNEIYFSERDGGVVSFRVDVSPPYFDLFTWTDRSDSFPDRRVRSYRSVWTPDGALSH